MIRPHRALGVVSLLLLGIVGFISWIGRQSDPLDAADVVGREVTTLAGEGSRRFTAASRSQLSRLAALTDAMLAGDAPRSEALASQLGYEIVAGVDADGRRVVAARELPGGSRRGWGTLVVADEGDDSMVVEVPHPVADQDTEQIGLALFRVLRARALLVAGAHRDAGGGSADPAHNPSSPFHSMHRQLMGRGVVAVQPHGFSTSRHPDLSADVVVSSAQDEPTPLVARWAEQLRSAGIAACAYGTPNCGELGGTTNVQAQHTTAAGGQFVHLEISTRIRENPGWATIIADALRQS